MRRFSVLAVALVVMVFPSLSFADAPVQESFTNEPFVIDESSCGFPVLVDPLGGGSKLLTFSN